MTFSTCVMTRDGGGGREGGEFDVHCDPLGPSGPPMVGLLNPRTQESMEKTFDTSQVLPGIKIGNGLHSVFKVDATAFR